MLVEQISICVIGRREQSEGEQGAENNKSQGDQIC